MMSQYSIWESSFQVGRFRKYPKVSQNHQNRHAKAQHLCDRTFWLPPSIQLQAQDRTQAGYTWNQLRIPAVADHYWNVPVRYLARLRVNFFVLSVYGFMLLLELMVTLCSFQLEYRCMMNHKMIYYTSIPDVLRSQIRLAKHLKRLENNWGKTCLSMTLTVKPSFPHCTTWALAG